MRWLRTALLLPLLLPMLARAQTALPIMGFCLNGAKQALVSGTPSTNYNQSLIPLCKVSVVLSGTTIPATIFKDKNQTPLDNPFTANADASWTFFVTAPATGQPAQAYDAILSGGNPPNTYSMPRTLLGLVGESGVGGGSGSVGGGTKNQVAIYPDVGNAVIGSSLIPNGITATTQSPGDNSNLIATDAFVKSVAGGLVTQGGPNQIAIYSILGTTVAGSGTVPNGITATTQAPTDATNLIATDAFVTTKTGDYLPLAGGVMTGPISWSPATAAQTTLTNLIQSLPFTPVGVAIAPQPSGGTGYSGTPSLTLSGGTCTTNPVLVDYNAGGILTFQLRDPGACTVAPSVTIGPDSTGTGASVSIQLAGSTLTTNNAGVPALTENTGYGKSVLSQSPFLVTPIVQGLTLHAGAESIYAAINLDTAGCSGPFIFYTQGLQFTTVCGGASDYTGFWAGNNSVQMKIANITVQPDLITLYTNNTNNGIGFNPYFLGVALAQPMASGLDWYLSNNGPLSAYGYAGNSSGYTNPGTCTLTGGFQLSGGTDTCATALGASGQILLSVTTNGLWSSPPLANVSGLVGGVGAPPTYRLYISHLNSISGSFWQGVDQFHTVHISGAAKGVAGSDFLAVSSTGLMVPGIKSTSVPNCLQVDTAGNVTPTGSACGSGGGGGGGTVTNVLAPAANWPTWLVPTVTSSTTTPTISVAASAIPLTSLATLSANVVLGATSATSPQQLPMPSCGGLTNALTWTSGSGFGCNTITGGGGGGTVTHTTGNLTLNQLVIGNSVADVKADPSAGTDGAGNLTVVSSSTNGTTPGKTSWAAGVGNIPALLANSAGFAAPVTGGTSYLFKLSPTITAGVLHAAAPALGDNVNESLLTSSPVNLAADVGGSILPVANGGTGTATPSLIQGANVTITGTWPNQTIAATGGGGGGLPTGATGQGIFYATGGTTGTPTSDIIHTGATAGSPLGFNVATPLNMFDYAGSVGLLGTGPATNTTSSVAFVSGATTLTVTSTTGYPTSGVLLIGITNFAPELISYTGTTPTTFTGLSRALYGTTQNASQASGMAVVLVSYLLDDGTTLTPKWICFWKGNCMYAPSSSDLVSSGPTNQGSLAVGGTVYATSFVVGGSSGGAGMQVSGTNGVLWFNGAATTIGAISGTGQLSTTGNSVSLATPTTISATSLTTTGLVMPVLSSVSAPITYHARCSVIWEQSTAAATVTFGIGASAAPTNLWVMNTIHSGALGATLNDLYTSITTTTLTNISQAGTPGSTATGYKDEIDFTIVNPASTANTITIYGLTSNVSDALVIEPGSYCEWLP